MQIYADARAFQFASYVTTKTVMSMAVCCLASNHKVLKKAGEKIDNYFAENPDEAKYSLYRNGCFGSNMVLSFCEQNYV